jgi:hypothetical protein
MELLWHHEYLLAFYGVLIWQIERYFHFDGSLKEYFQKSIKNVGSSMIWVGLGVVFDDELLAQYNKLASVDYSSVPLIGYVVLGFLINILRSSFLKSQLKD